MCLTRVCATPRYRSELVTSEIVDQFIYHSYKIELIFQNLVAHFKLLETGRFENTFQSFVLFRQEHI